MCLASWRYGWSFGMSRAVRLAFAVAAILVVAAGAGCALRRDLPAYPGVDAEIGPSTTDVGRSTAGGQAGASGAGGISRPPDVSTAPGTGATGGVGPSVGTGASGGQAAPSVGSAGAGLMAGGGGASSGGGRGGGENLEERLVFVRQPLGTKTGVPMGAFTVAVEDPTGAVVTTAANPITLTLSAGVNVGAANLLGLTSESTVAGVATFDTVGLDQPGKGYTLTAASPGLLPVTSAAFDATAPAFVRAPGYYGGPVTSLAISGGPAPVLYAGTPAGVFQSTNDGLRWSAANFGNPGEADLVVVDPRNPTTAFIASNWANSSLGAAHGGLKLGKTTDGGRAWRSVGDSAGAQVDSLVIDPFNPAIVYVGGSGVYKSTNGGETWSVTSFPGGCLALAIDPVAPSTLYASGASLTAAAKGTFFKSTDAGIDWIRIDNPAIDPTDLPIVAVFATPTGVFAATATKLFRSIDGGATWSALAASGTVVAYAPSEVTRVYLGHGRTVLVSDDGGATFAAHTDLPAILSSQSKTSLAVHPTNPSCVYAATDDGLFVSRDGSTTWTSSSAGMSTLRVAALAVDPASPATIFAGGPDAVYRTIDDGLSWSRFPTDDVVGALAIDPLDSRKIYACTQAARLYRSSDGGATWSPPVDSGGSPYCYDVAINGSSLWMPTVGGGVRRSTDGGMTWASTGIAAPSYALAIDATGTRVYAATNMGTFRSTDAGTTFSLMTSDLAEVLLLDPLNPSIVYAGLGCGGGVGAVGAGGIRRSLDGGSTWQSTAGTLCVRAMAGVPGGPLFAVGYGGSGFVTSTDQGGTLVAGGEGIVGDASSVAAAPDGKTVYVGTLSGLFKSTSGGR